MSVLRRMGVAVNVTDVIQKLIEEKPNLEHYDVLVLDEYQDIDLEISLMLRYIKEENPQAYILAEDWSDCTDFLNGDECVRMCACNGEQYVNSFQLNNKINF